jgi:hypothetical protein
MNAFELDAHPHYGRKTPRWKSPQEERQRTMLMPFIEKSYEKTRIFKEKSRKDKLMQNRESGSIRRENIIGFLM